MTEDGWPLILDDDYDIQYLTYISEAGGPFPHENAYYGGVLTKRTISWFTITFYSLGYDAIVGTLARTGSGEHPLRLTPNDDLADAEFACALGNCVEAYDKLDNFCKGNPGSVVKLVGSGGRRSSTRVGEEFIQGHRLLVGGMRHVCVFTAICNAVHKVVRRKYAMKVISQPLWAVWSLSALSVWTQKYASCVTLDRVTASKENSVSWLLPSVDGIYILRMKGTGDIDHVVCLDTTKRWLLDGAERRTLRLSKASFDDCCGDRSRLDGVREIRKVRMLVHPSNESKHTRSGAEKRRRKA